jgi:hypothetical protein
MTKKFDPAPLDKHAADPNEAAKADRDMQAKLKSGLLGTFPASDPVSITQPPSTKHDVARRQELSFWQKVATMFK